MGINDECSFITASNNNVTFVTLGHDSVLYNLRVSNYTEDEAEIVRCVIQNASIAINIIAININGLGAQASNVFSEATGTAFYANGGTILMHNSFSSGATNALYANNGGTLNPHLVNCIGGTNIVRTGSAGVNTIHVQQAISIWLAVLF